VDDRYSFLAVTVGAALFESVGVGLADSTLAVRGACGVFVWTSMIMKTESWMEAVRRKGFRAIDDCEG
jgi:hypothetical protein